MSAGFVHLHVHSEYSLADGIVRIPALAGKVALFDQPAVALTDLGNVYGVVKFYRACLANGVKPLLGADVWLQNPLDTERADRAILLCQDNAGYRNLSALLTQAYLRGQVRGKVMIDRANLETHASGLLVLLDDQEGPLAQGTGDQDDEVLDAYHALFADRLYLQVSRTGAQGEEEYIERAASLAAARGIGVVATNRVEFLQQDDFAAHEIRVCINDGRVLDDSRRPRRFTTAQYLRTTAEMQSLFADMPEALANTVEIALRCNVFLNFDEDYLPDYPDVGDDTEDEILLRNARAGLCERLGVADFDAGNGSDGVGEAYRERLAFELGVIEKMGYAGYFLIVADFIRWARENDIPVGPGRGSGAGSLVAWSTGITELDPLDYGLLFERFLNPERISLPDFDIDFCVDGRDRVIEYVAERYGRDQVAQIITFGTMAAKAVVRDVGRVMSLPYGFVDQVAKLIPFEVGMTLEKALDQEDQLRERYEQEGEIQELIDNAMQLEGIARNVGKHAGGVVIAPQPLTEYTPLYADTHLNQAITQLDKDDLEAIGLVKFDFLGLRTLTIIHNAVRMVNEQRLQRGEEPLEIENVPLDDEATFRMIRTGATTAIFQLESRGMRELIIRLCPDKFDDLVALVALFRPGPLQSGMVDDFIARKHGREPIRYPHPDVAPILEPTYGVILYQEQVMQIAQVLAGYTLGGSDILRSAMGKKKPAEMAKQRQIFSEGADKRGVDPDVAKHIFDLMEKFAGYGFNKSHSVAYALVAYQTAWLKTHYPAAFMAATLSADLDHTDKVVTLLADCAELELEVHPPNINACFHGFRPVDERTILYGVGAVKGVGRAVIEGIEAEREEGGAFASLFEFCNRLDTRKVNKRVLEALVKSGAMDELGDHRSALMAAIPAAMQAAGQQQQSREAGQSDMFGEVEAPAMEETAVVVDPWTDAERLAAEKETLGLYLTGHPYHRYRAELESITPRNVQGMDLGTPKQGLFAGLVVALRVLKTRRGKMAFVTLDNAADRVEVSFFSDLYTEYQGILAKDRVLVVAGEFSSDEYTGGIQMKADRAATVDEFRRECLRDVEITLDEEGLDRETLRAFQELLGGYREGNVGVTIRYQRVRGETGVMRLPDDWRLDPAPELFEALAVQPGLVALECRFDTSGFRPEQTSRQRYWPRAASGR